MAKKTIKQRPQVGVLGKFITRRSRGQCELCEAREGTMLFELVPFPEDPDPDRTLLACARCRDWLERETMDPIEAHFLSSAVWHEEPAVRLAAARILLSHEDVSDPWLADALDAAGVDPRTREFRATEEHA